LEQFVDHLLPASFGGICDEVSDFGGIGRKSDECEVQSANEDGGFRGRCGLQLSTGECLPDEGIDWGGGAVGGECRTRWRYPGPVRGRYEGIWNDSTFGNPLPDDFKLLLCEGIADGRHVLRVRCGQCDASQQFTVVGFVREQDAGFQQSLALVDAEVTELLQRPVALQAVATEDGIDIAAKGDRGIVLLRDGVRVLGWKQQQAGEQQSDLNAITDGGCG